VSRNIKFTKQYKPMGFGDGDDRGSVEAHLRAEAHAKEMRRFNKRMRELDAEGAQRRGGLPDQGCAVLLVEAWDTLMDNKALLALWKLEEMPACEEGIMLAQAFLISCGEGVNRLGTEEPSDRITDLTACYMALVEHGEGCDNCSEV
jgi:hypothetical protein